LGRDPRRAYRPAHSAHGDLYWRVVMWPKLLPTRIGRPSMGRRHSVDEWALPEPLFEGNPRATPPSELSGWLTREGTIVPAGEDGVWFTGEGSVRPVHRRRQRQRERGQGPSQETRSEIANGALRRRLLGLALLIVVLVTAAAAYHVGKECGAWEARTRLQDTATSPLCLRGSAPVESAPGAA
jgi:hypothetical protein